MSDEFVLRILINQAKIERTLLTPTRSAADDLLRGTERGGQCLTADLWRVQRYRFVCIPALICMSCITSYYPSDGGGQSQPMYPLRPNDQRNLLFTDKNAEAQLRFVLQTLGISVQFHISSFP